MEKMDKIIKIYLVSSGKYFQKNQDLYPESKTINSQKWTWLNRKHSKII